MKIKERTKLVEETLKSKNGQTCFHEPWLHTGSRQWSVVACSVANVFLIWGLIIDYQSGSDLSGRRPLHLTATYISLCPLVSSKISILCPCGSRLGTLFCHGGEDSVHCPTSLHIADSTSLHTTVTDVRILYTVQLHFTLLTVSDVWILQLHFALLTVTEVRIL